MVSVWRIVLDCEHDGEVPLGIGKYGLFQQREDRIVFLGLVRDHPGVFWGLGEPAWDRIPCQTPQKREDRGITPVPIFADFARIFAERKRLCEKPYCCC